MTMPKEKAVTLAQKLRRLIDHEATPENERKVAENRLRSLMMEYEVTQADLDFEEIEDDIPVEASYDEVWQSILAHLGIPEDGAFELMGITTSKALKRIWIVGDLLEHADKKKLGKAVMDIALTLFKKGDI